MVCQFYVCLIYCAGIDDWRYKQLLSRRLYFEHYDFYSERIIIALHKYPFNFYSTMLAKLSLEYFIDM